VLDESLPARGQHDEGESDQRGKARAARPRALHGAPAGGTRTVTSYSSP
jgi:hypothetical protein